MSLAIKQVIFQINNYPTLSFTMRNWKGNHASTSLKSDGTRIRLDCIEDFQGQVQLRGLGIESRQVDLNGDSVSDIFFIFGHTLRYQESFWRGWNLVADLKTGKIGKTFEDNDGIDRHEPALFDMQKSGDELYITINTSEPFFA